MTAAASVFSRTRGVSTYSHLLFGTKAACLPADLLLLGGQIQDPAAPAVSSLLQQQRSGQASLIPSKSVCLRLLEQVHYTYKHSVSDLFRTFLLPPLKDPQGVVFPAVLLSLKGLKVKIANLFLIFFHSLFTLRIDES